MHSVPTPTSGLATVISSSEQIWKSYGNTFLLIAKEWFYISFCMPPSYLSPRFERNAQAEKKKYVSPLIGLTDLTYNIVISISTHAYFINNYKSETVCHTNGMFFLWCTHSFGNASVFFFWCVIQSDHQS